MRQLAKDVTVNEESKAWVFKTQRKEKLKNWTLRPFAHVSFHFLKSSTNPRDYMESSGDSACLEFYERSLTLQRHSVQDLGFIAYYHFSSVSLVLCRPLLLWNVWR
ncbi:hypothetical protein I7I48_02673 [Histoplasma ohiense]|nr:hypothetical protein I7I48_02673 [Histoplasma ohiense (nom. inval.)]